MKTFAPTLFDRDVCESRHQGSAESIAAWERAKPALPAARARVLEIIAQAGALGATAKEVAAELGVGLNEISGRATELKAAGLVRKNGLRREGSAVLVANGEECQGKLRSGTARAVQHLRLHLHLGLHRPQQVGRISQASHGWHASPAAISRQTPLLAGSINGWRSWPLADHRQETGHQPRVR